MLILIRPRNPGKPHIFRHEGNLNTIIHSFMLLYEVLKKFLLLQKIIIIIIIMIVLRHN